MKSKPIIIKCRKFDQNWVIDRATSMWISPDAINRQIAITPEQEQMRSARYNRIFYIVLVNAGSGKDYDEYFLDKVSQPMVALPTS